jgi:hypothetical protein
VKRSKIVGNRAGRHWLSDAVRVWGFSLGSGQKAFASQYARRVTRYGPTTYSQIERVRKGDYVSENFQGFLVTGTSTEGGMVTLSVQGAVSGEQSTIARPVGHLLRHTPRLRKAWN